MQQDFQFWIRYRSLICYIRTDSNFTIDNRRVETVEDLISCIQRRNYIMARVPLRALSIHKPLLEGREFGVGEKFPYDLPVEIIALNDFGQSEEKPLDLVYDRQYRASFAVSSATTNNPNLFQGVWNYIANSFGFRNYINKQKNHQPLLVSAPIESKAENVDPSINSLHDGELRQRNVESKNVAKN